MPGSRDVMIAGAVADWFEGHARDLPWRRTGADGRRDPYRSLVSEFMLQQTQVSRVLEKFGGFMDRFPSVGSLASADEHDVLAAWSGLGYYRRARHLHAAAKDIVSRFGGMVPSDVELLRTIPGVGRYTAGAIASIVFHRSEALVDGNVVRVLMRLDARDGTAGDRTNSSWAWDQAERLVAQAGDRVALLNEGLMELGAMVCTPKTPHCTACPLRGMCVAAGEGRQHEIPRVAARAKRRVLYCSSVVVRDGDGRVLIERRGDGGLWAGLWQAPTIERDDRHADPHEISGLVGADADHLVGVGAFAHATTHRDVRFRVWRLDGWAGETGDRRWVAPDELVGYGISNAQRRVLALDGAWVS